METTISKWKFIKMSEKNRVIFVEVVIALFFLLFMYTAISKIQTFERFEKTLSRTPLISNYNTLIAWTIPSVEILISILLIIPSKKIIGLYASLVTMLVFTGYLIYMVNSGSELPCHCGGVITKLNWIQHIWFNVFFIVLAILALVLGKNRKIK